MKHILLVAFLGMETCSLTNGFAQPNIVATFEIRSHTFQGTTLPYRLFVPEKHDSTEQYPLVLALHGAGERGDNNITHVASYRLATVWADPANQVTYPCFVVAPQCPEGRSWSYGFYPAPLGAELATVVDILDSLMIEFSIDENRQYVTGLSMGGYGTWNLITRFPDRFAAAVPMSAGCDPSLADRILHIPIWNFHGALDEAVPVNASRVVMDALEQAGRTVLYTHCHGHDCRSISEGLMDMYVESHADLFHTEYGDGGHIIWDESYDHPNLIPWVFDHYRRIPDSIGLTNLEAHRTLRGVETIRWTSTNPEDSVEMWYSPDAGGTWKMVSSSEPNTGQYEWNTEAFEDCAFGLVKIFLKNDGGFLYGFDQSHSFTIDNEMNGRPFVRILNDEFWRDKVFDRDVFDLRLLLGDAENDSLDVKVLFSVNNGHLFMQFDNFKTVTDTVPKTRSIHLGNLPNSGESVIRIEVSDGMVSSADETNGFVKETPRLPGPEVDHVSGSSGAIVTVHIVNEEQLTGDVYRITFDQTTCCPGLKIYNVLNVHTGIWVVEMATQLDGVAEGPLFDGIRLIIQDFNPSVVDMEKTGWSVGTSNLEISIYLPEITLGTEVLRGIPYPADYRITLRDYVADTSSGAYGSTPVPMYFDIWNVTDDREADVIFVDVDNNQTLSRLDELFILLPYGVEPGLTWTLFFGGQPSAHNPQPGDVFELITRKPIGIDDVYEFRAVTTSPQKGDVNHDYVVDILDVSLTINIMMHTVEPTPDEMWAADCNGRQGNCEGDGILSVLDVVKIIRIHLGLETCL